LLFFGLKANKGAMMNNTTTPTEKEAALKALRDELKGSDSKTQCQRLLEALRRFPVTTFEAMRLLDVYHVPARVLQLRKAGHSIVTLWQTITTEAGVTHRVGLYVLMPKSAQGGAA
jgi:Helix-turn-helix domain